MTDETNPDELPLTAAQADAAAAYHAPPDIVPRDAMWDAIRARRTRRTGSVLEVTSTAQAVATPVTVLHTSRRTLRRTPRWVAVASAAAVVVLVVSISRREPVPATSATPAVSLDSAANSVAWQLASAEHFGLAESMLTMLSNSPKQQGDAQLTAWSRDLLESTRLLIDSPAGRDPKRRVLLMELELILVQLVESGPAMRIEDRTMMDNLLSQSALLLTRIRTTVPAGMSAVRNQ